MKNNSEIKLETAVFGGGCFWGVEARFSKVKGVTSVVSGYAGGTKENPTYEDVLTGRTGHAEAVKIEFDPSVVTFQDLLVVFFNFHDPTTLNRQGPYVGTNYRSLILYADDDQKNTAEAFVKKMEKEKAYSRPITTEIKPLEKFWPAEEYHQKYFEKHQGGSCHI